VSIRRVGNRWQIRLRVGGGQRVERTLPTGATKEDARAVENQIRRRQIDALAGRKPDVLIDEALDKWLTEEVRHQKSAQRTIQRVNVLKEFTTGKRLTALQEVASSLKSAEAKPATINRYLSVLRRIGNLAETWGWIERAPKIQLLEERNERHIYLSALEVERLARACQRPEVADYVRLAALTGLRRSELLGLGADAIRESAIFLDARTKTGRPRAVPLTPEALAIAHKRIPWQVTVHDIRGDFERARKAIGRPDVHLHDLRHTFASFLVGAEVHMKVVKELLGHTTMAMTDRYAHLADKHLQRAAKGLPRIGRK
jgi:integrase